MIRDAWFYGSGLATGFLLALLLLDHLLGGRGPRVELR